MNNLQAEGFLNAEHQSDDLDSAVVNVIPVIRIGMALSASQTVSIEGQPYNVMHMTPGEARVWAAQVLEVAIVMEMRADLALWCNRQDLDPAAVIGDLDAARTERRTRDRLRMQA